MEETQKPSYECPYCHKKIIVAVGVNVERPPRPGDVSVCGNCAEIIIFTGEGISAIDYVFSEDDIPMKLGLRRTRPEELVKILKANPILNDIQKKILSHNNSRWRR